MADQSNVAEFSVSEVSNAIKRTVEDAFDYVRVRGELGRVSKPGSGHIYLDLKDDRSVLAGVIWRGNASRLKVQPEQGLEVIATGKITTFPGQSKYQMVIESMEPAGAGALMALLEERKKKLGAEGLFDPAAKKQLPRMPRVVGVVTSPTGAVIRDILHRITDRFPLHVVVWPVRVQGETCGAEVANGIRGFNALPKTGPIPKPDVLIVARGGGSLEDLWGFNDEEAVRAAAASDIPLVSAVGHETDWTLIDLAADMRAPTPTGAAEFVVPVKAELVALTDDLSRRLSTGLLRFLQGRKTELRAAAASLPAPRDLLALPRQRFDMSAGRLEYGLRMNTQSHRTKLTTAARGLSPITLSRQMAFSKERLESMRNRKQQAYTNHIRRQRMQLDSVSQLLSSLSYKRVIERGYAVVRDDEMAPIGHASAISQGQTLHLEMKGGTVVATAGDTPVPAEPTPTETRAETSSSGLQETAEPPAKKKAVRTKKKTQNDAQGSLF
ncbi:exodeoxyribonuclease VII large subunit [Pseudovibrio exalbescens]|uniref:exodeoxyribonuclease VII large subunit n=1 Tax=Pseudovibrio exalbescens TaxID=197461 RepID=UPI000C9AED9F|nr:exodeoxyribonuclease VII large subunit [Pseudovibrio exalbescens]